MSRFLLQQWHTNMRAIGSWFLLVVGILLWVPPVYRLLSSENLSEVIQSSQLLEAEKPSGNLAVKRLNHNQESQRMAIK